MYLLTSENKAVNDHAFQSLTLFQVFILTDYVGICVKGRINDFGFLSAKRPLLKAYLQIDKIK